MAALIHEANVLANSGAADSGWDSWSGYLYNPDNTFPIGVQGTLLAECEEGGDCGDDEGAPGGGPKGSWVIG